MHSCKLTTNLHTKKVQCDCAQVAKNFRCCNNRLCFFCNVIGSWKITHRQQSMLMKPEGSVGCHQTLSSQVGSGHETIIYVDKPLVFLCGLQCKNKLVVSTTKWLPWLQTSWRASETTYTIILKIIVTTQYFWKSLYFLKCSCSDSSQMFSVVRYMGSGCLCN